MTGRPVFDPANATTPVDAADMNLISTSGLQRFDTRAARDAAIPAPADGEVTVVIEADPPLETWRQAANAGAGAWLALNAIIGEAEVDGSVSPAPERVVPRDRRVSSWAEQPLEPAEGTLTTAPRTDPGVRFLNLGSSHGTYTDTAEVARPASLSSDDMHQSGLCGGNGRVLAVLGHDRRTVYQIAPPQTTAPTVRSSSTAGPAADETITAFVAGPTAADDLLITRTSTDPAVTNIWDRDAAGWKLAGPITAGRIAAACFDNDGALWCFEDRPLAVNVPAPNKFGPQSVLYEFDAAARTETQRQTLNWPYDNDRFIRQPTGACWHRNRLYCFTATSKESITRTGLVIDDLLWRLEPTTGGGFDLGIAAVGTRGRSLGPALIGIGAAAHNQTGLPRIWSIALTPGSPGRAIRQVSYGWAHPAGPWDLP